jgi:hypothetical protein
MNILFGWYCSRGDTILLSPYCIHDDRESVLETDIFVKKYSEGLSKREVRERQTVVLVFLSQKDVLCFQSRIIPGKRQQLCPCMSTVSVTERIKDLRGMRENKDTQEKKTKTSERNTTTMRGIFSCDEDPETDPFVSLHAFTSPRNQESCSLLERIIQGNSRKTVSRT